jgi:hypothetical protein
MSTTNKKRGLVETELNVAAAGNDASAAQQAKKPRKKAVTAKSLG